MIEVPFSNIPKDLLELISTSLHSYSTVLIKIPKDARAPEDLQQIGSGTLVSIGNLFGILTARHVSRELEEEPCELGLAMFLDEHVYSIPREYLNFVPSPTAKDESKGPDISLIILPSNIGTIKSLKSFYDLNFHKQELLTAPPQLDSGAWFLCGTPAEGTKTGKSEKGFRGTTSFYGTCGLTIARREYPSGEYDYIEVGAHYDEKTDTPLTLGGMSGGGLWQVLIRKLENGEFEPTKYLLSGVIFYQSKLENQHRIIKCHGRRSIYKTMYDKVALHP